MYPKNLENLDVCKTLDCKTVRIFAYSSTREQSNKKACEPRASRVRKTLTPHFTDFFTDFEKKNPTVLLSSHKRKML